MPWKFENNVGNIVKYFFPSNIYIVGRISANLIINDKSVSRKHATIIWPSNQRFLEVEDLSKFGTFINKSPLIGRKGILKDGDIITFGAQPGVDFKCSFEPFDIITSALVNNERQLLKVYLSVCGSNIVNDWNDGIEYLVMSTVKVTYKVVCALIKQVNIVTIDFVKEMLDYFKGIRLVKPKPEEYVPRSEDKDFSDKNTFKVNFRRRNLFFKKKFYFMSDEKKAKLEEAIISGGGTTDLLIDSSWTEDSLRLILSDTESIVVYETSQNSLVNKVYCSLKEIRKRPIIDSEIGFAVLCGSIDEYCNTTKPCKSSIYSETKYSQAFTINPFYLNEENPTKSDRVSASKKRILLEYENSEPCNLKRLKSSFINTDSKTNSLVDQENVNLSSHQQLSTSTVNSFKNGCYDQDKLSGKSERKMMQLVQERQADLFNTSSINQENFGNVTHQNQSTISKKCAIICLKTGTEISKSAETDLFDDNSSMDQEFDNNQISEISPVNKDYLNLKSSHKFDYTNSDTIKYMPLVKMSYSTKESCKNFKKVSQIYINPNPMNMFKYK